MATIRSGFGIGSLSEISDEGSIRVSIDLVAAARKNVRFIRIVAENDWLHHTPTIVEAIRRSKFTCLTRSNLFRRSMICMESGIKLILLLRRYEELWMPLISDCTVGSKVHTLLPPIDVEWIWFCHTLNPVSYCSTSRVPLGCRETGENIAGKIDKKSTNICTVIVWLN